MHGYWEAILEGGSIATEQTTWKCGKGKEINTTTLSPSSAMTWNYTPRSTRVIEHFNGILLHKSLDLLKSSIFISKINKVMLIN